MKEIIDRYAEIHARRVADNRALGAVTIPWADFEQFLTALKAGQEVAEWAQAFCEVWDCPACGAMIGEFVGEHDPMCGLRPLITAFKEATP